MNRLAKLFEEVADTRRVNTIAYGDGWLAYQNGLPMESPIAEPHSRSLWYEGYLDAKYPEHRYDFLATVGEVVFKALNTLS